MARQPFFSGNYGSALGQIDTRPIMQGAAAQAAMYQGLGQNIGGAIEKYQLNKEKREKNEAAAIGTISGMPPQMLQALSANPETAKLLERIQGENASPKDFDKFNAMSAAYTVQQNAALEQEGARAANALGKSQGELAQLQAELERRIMGDKEQLSHSEAYGSELANDRARIENELLKAKSKADKDRLERELQDHKIKMKTARQALKANKADLNLFNETYDDKVRLAASQADAAEAEIDFTKAREELTKEETLLKKAEVLTEKNKKKYKPGDKEIIDGKAFYWTGNVLAPVGAELTSGEVTTAALKAFGGEALLTYYDDTRDDEGNIDLGIGQLDALDPFKENLLLKIGMKLNSQGKPTSGTTDRVALARQALQDPNATPQVKEQAKRILQMAGQ